MTLCLQVKPRPDAFNKKYQPVKPESKSKSNSESKIVDWDESLHCYWLEKMAGTNSTFYDDARILHGNSCRCCTRIGTGCRNLMEVRKRK